MLTGRERVELAFSPEGTPAFGAVTSYQGIFLRDHWEECTDAPWWELYDPDPVVAARPWVDMVRRTGEDWYPVVLGATREEQTNVAIEPTENGVFRVHRRTGERRLIVREPVGGFQSVPRDDAAFPAHGVRDGYQLLELMERLYGASVHHRLDRGCLDLPQELHRALGREHVPVGHISAPLWRCAELWSFSERMTLMAERPDLIEQACAQFVQYDLDDIATLREAGARIVWIEDCTSDLVSPRLFARLGVPYLRPLTEAIRSAGMWSVHYYCGRPDDRAELLLDTGADGLAVEESKKGFCIDILDVADRLQGRMVLFGNVDALNVMAHGSDTELQAEIARQCEAGKRNRRRFVVSVGSPITPATPLHRVRRYCELVHRMGKELS